jgi:hypothetical protein
MAPPDPDRFIHLLHGLMRPLVRLLIARGVTAPAFYRVLKRVYVQEAHAAFRIDAEPPTDSRIALLTGVHRRDVRKILEAGDDGWEDARRKSAAFATVLGRWLSRPDLTGPDGAPLPLSRSGAEGRDFDSLVREVSTDIRPRTVLDELLRQGLVRVGEDGLLRVAAAPVAGPGSDEDRLVFFAANLGDHLAAAAENLLAETPPHFERSVFYTRLSAASVDRIEGQARAQGQALLEEINRAGGAAQEADRGATDNAARFRLGIFFYRQPGPGPAGADDDDNGG